jgi:hypothetical protein
MPIEYLPINEKQWEETGSKFVSKPGRYVATMQMPKWKNVGKSYEFPFVISQEGLEKGKAGSDYPGMVKFNLEPWFVSCRVPFKFEGGKLAFDKALFVNKQFIAVYTDQVGTGEYAGKSYVKFDHPEPISESGSIL